MSWLSEIIGGFFGGGSSGVPQPTLLSGGAPNINFEALMSQDLSDSEKDIVKELDRIISLQKRIRLPVAKSDAEITRQTILERKAKGPTERRRGVRSTILT